VINSQLKYLLRKRDFISEKKKKKDIMNASYNTPVPYLSKFANKFKEVIHGLDTRLSFYSLNKLGGIIKAQKDILKIYRIKMWCINYAKLKIVTLLMLNRRRDS